MSYMYLKSINNTLENLSKPQMEIKYNYNITENKEFMLIYPNTVNASNSNVPDIQCKNYNTNNVLPDKHELFCKKLSSIDIFKHVTSVIVSKSNNKIVTYFTKNSSINSDAKNCLNSTKTWDNLVISECFDAPIIKIYNDPSTNEWYISSEYNIDANTIYGKNKSIRDIFNEINKNIFDELDNRFVYQFILLHNKYKNIVQYNNLGNDYKELVLQNVTLNGLYVETLFDNQPNEFDIEKYIEDHIDEVIIKKNLMKPTIYNFSCYNEFINTLDKINYDNVIYKRISTEGFNIYDSINNYTYRIQTDIFIQLSKIKSTFKNNYQLYLCLYQKDKLNDILPYMSKYSNEIIHRINTSMKTLAREFLNIYHVTRQKNNKNLYDCLTDQYRKVLYGIHGIYIKKRKQDFTQSNRFFTNDIHTKTIKLFGSNNKQTDDNFDDKIMETKSITVHDIYYYIKNLPYDQLKQIYLDRIELLNDSLLVPHIDTNCMYTLTQARLMIMDNLV